MMQWPVILPPLKAGSVRCSVKPASLLFPATLGPERTKPPPKHQAGHLWLARIACAVTGDHSSNLTFIQGKLNLFLRHLLRKNVRK
jgi:hypothetical protein